MSNDVIKNIIGTDESSKNRVLIRKIRQSPTKTPRRFERKVLPKPKQSPTLFSRPKTRLMPTIPPQRVYW